MVTRCIDIIPGGKFLDDFDVGDEPGPGERPFEEIVAEKPVLARASVERGYEGIDVINALADIRAFAEEVLIHIRHRGGVRVDAVHAGEDALEQRAFAADRQRRRYARLQYTVAFDDAADGAVESRTVEGMRSLADETLSGLSRQPCVGVERDDVADAGRRCGRTSLDRHEGRIRCPAQQPIQLMELPPFAFPTDPELLSRIPNPSAMEQEETRPAGTRAMKAIQARDPLSGGVEERLVAVRPLRLSVRPIRKQSEVEFPFRGRKVMNLQPLDLLVERGRRR